MASGHGRRTWTRWGRSSSLANVQCADPCFPFWIWNPAFRAPQEDYTSPEGRDGDREKEVERFVPLRPSLNQASFSTLFLTRFLGTYSSSTISSSKASSSLRTRQAHPVLRRRSSSDPHSRRSLETQLVRSNLPLRPARGSRRGNLEAALSSLRTRSTSCGCSRRRVGHAELGGNCIEDRRQRVWTWLRQAPSLMESDGKILQVVSLE